MTPEEYEHLVADVLRREGWDAQVTPYTGDFGVDVVAVLGTSRLGVQAKMYGGANRSINAETVMLTYGAGAYADCSEFMIATDSQALASAVKVAAKLGVEIRNIPAVKPLVADPTTASVSTDTPLLSSLSFGEIWAKYVAPLAGTTLSRDNGKTNEILTVDDAGLTRRTSTGRAQRIDIEIFRWTIEKLLHGETVSRDDINQHYAKRASSGITLILTAIPLFEATALGGQQGTRLKREPPTR
jgi:hypothetical protein